MFTFILFAKNIYSQIQFFDSVRVLASSDNYSYKNPVFDNHNNLINQEGLIVYERHSSSSSSDIMIRKYNYTGYLTEVSLTGNSGFLNINPSYTNNIIVWQSNASGNWDLYYSLNNNGWSAPELLDSASSVDTSPYIYCNNYYPIENNFYYLAYKKDNNISFKKFRTSTGVWDYDTVITSGNENYEQPIITTAYESNRYCVVYLKKYTDDFTRINISPYYHYTSVNIFLEPSYEIYQPNSQSALTVSNSYSTMISYSYDTLGRKNILGFRIDYPIYKEVLTESIPGVHISGKGQNMNIVTENSISHFSAFALNTVSSDSSYLTLARNIGSNGFDTVYKKFYLSDTSLNLKYDLSQPVYFSFYFRINAVWEKIINGRTLLVESSMTDMVSAINNNEINLRKYSLIQNYPNPFNPSTNLEFEIPELGFVSLKVYDALGQVVRTLINDSRPAGNYKVEFDGSDLPSGVYFYRLESGEFSETKRMILLK